ncbi:MAG: manganese efflux pump MntP family protein [Ruminococcus sp.]|nr:manganese efflux pump MntP family protein [Ruminococcus sp.]
MGIIELLLLAVSLSMDAFAVSVCQGLSMKSINKKKTLIIGLYFGGFQALMPLMGWALGTQFESYITSIDHWIAFILLAIIGSNMIIESFKKDVDEINAHDGDTINHKELFMLAIATSIDALTVGIMFAFLNVDIVQSVSIIGVCTFILSIVGIYIGNRFGSKYKNKAEFIGGLILILIGLKVLLEHLGILN